MAEQTSALAQADKAGLPPPSPDVVSAIARALADSALPDEAMQAGDDGWTVIANFVAATAQGRRPGNAAMQLETMPGQAGGRRMRLAIINDDMPFLVDSVAGAIGGQGLSIYSIIHPVVAVRRDAEGRLTDIIDGDASGERRESMIYIELDRADARARRELTQAIDAVLADVRAAVADWLKLQAAMQGDAERLGDGEAAALLRWFLDRNFTLLGHESRARDGGASGALGVCRSGAVPLLAASTLNAAFGWFERGGRAPLIIKSNVVATVHRRVPIDLIILPVHGAGGIEALSIHAGLWTSAALATAPERVPVLRTALADLMRKFGFDPSGHAGKALSHVLTQLPHDLLIATDAAQLETVALAAMSIADRPRPRIAAIHSDLDRHLFVFVWLPRDEVSTGRRKAIEDWLLQRTHARILNWSIAMEDGGAALLRFTLDLRDGGQVPDVDALNDELELMVRGWVPGVAQALSAYVEEGRAATLAARFAHRLPLAYQLSHSVGDAALDILRLRDLAADQPVVTRLVGHDDDDERSMRLKVYSAAGALPLSRLVPTLENFGFTVAEELPTALEGEDGGYIHDLVLGGHASIADGRVAVVEAAIAAVLTGAAENDPFNQLIISAGIDPAAVPLLRAWFRYMRQAGQSWSLVTVVQALANAPAVTAALVDLFAALHDPARADDAAADAARTAALTALDGVALIDDDRILRFFLALVGATLRTNAFAPAAAEALAFKLDSALIPGLPQPLPWREIFVYSARVEGIHLRAGPVARGGLRWSDRRDDFRTEILGLMKAQRVKNAVIVPTGAKGGFFPKALPDAAKDREAWLAEGTECYRIFIRTLLSITDNRVDGAVVHPDSVVVRDGPDPYFVVAADKGTATFSDVANAIALDKDFWLGDAFASGGSNGYDHKAMGITARGAWLSVRRHFREMGSDVQADPVRVIGVGDMSGDVFGNGMLLSQSIKLVAAFDHRHIFLDPSPDAAASFAERLRLFALPRSSWADYNASLISRGGGIFPRSQKQIDLTPEVRAMLGIEAETLDPTSLIIAILKAEADLLWFGGIGTYVKAAAQNNAEVGDPANDRLRVDAEDLRVKVVGEGANLGITQAARIAFAQHGGRINTDFIDNSAGVDCSDNEVNIKIALGSEVRAGRLELPARNHLLASMTDDVAALVLDDNRLQALALSVAESGGVAELPSMIRLIERFEEAGQLDRAVEGLASNDELQRRAADQRGLTRPELAVILSTAKLAVQDATERSLLGSDPLMDGELLAAFPPPLVAAHRDALLGHQLRNEIVATKVANRLINRLGLVHPFELAEEEGVGIADVAEAFVVAEILFDCASLWAAIDAAAVSEAVRLSLYDDVAVELRAHMADLLRTAVAGRSLADCVTAMAPGIRQLDRTTSTLLNKQVRDQTAAFRQRLIARGVPAALADPVVHLAETDGAVGIVALAQRLNADPAGITQAFSRIGQATGLAWAQGLAMQMSPSDPWERLLVAGLARDFQQMRLDLIGRLAADPSSVDAWLDRHADRVRQFAAFVDRARRNPAPSPAMLAQLSGQARTLLGRI